MSTPQPTPRRRRIAGERRPRQPGDPTTAEQSVSATTPTPPPPAAPPPPRVTPDEAPPPPPPPPPPTSEPARERRSRSWLGSAGSLWGLGTGLLVLSVVLVILLVVAALTAFGLVGNTSLSELRQEKAELEAGRSASATAERAAAAVLAYDHRSLETGKENAVRFLADDFAEEYTSTFDKVVAPAARDTKATVTADVRASAVVRASEDEVRVLLFIDQTTQSTANPDPQLSLNRVEMVMVREGESWLVEEITSY